MARSSITKRERKVNGKGTGRYFYEARVVIGTYPGTTRPKEEGQSFPTKREAQQWANKRKAEIDQGVAVPRTKQTVADLIEYWMEHYVAHNVSQVTKENYTYNVRPLLDSPLAGVLAQELKPEQVTRWYTAQRNAGFGARILQVCHLRLSQAFKFGVKQGLVSRNPMGSVTAPTLQRKSMEVWTVPQVQKFLQVASESPYDGYGPIYSTILNTSLRRGEVLGLRWRDVDLDNGTITVNQTLALVRGHRTINPAPKTKSSNRTIPIDAGLVDLLRRHKLNRPMPTLDGSDFVFHTKTGTPVYPRVLARHFDHVVKAAGLPKLTLHGLRHTSISQALIMGLPLKAVSERAGHSRTSTTTDIYSHVGWEQHVDVADRLGAAFRVRTTG